MNLTTFINISLINTLPPLSSISIKLTFFTYFPSTPTTTTPPSSSSSSSSSSTMRTISTTTTTSLAPQATASLMRSSWHSPIPYLFGGLAAMLGLIAFALLILACSYWKLNGQLQSEENGNRDLENGEKEGGESASEIKVYEEKILVIMAGDENPTFLATPAFPKSSYFSDGVKNQFEKNLPNCEGCEKSQKEMENHLQPETQQQEQEQS